MSLRVLTDNGILLSKMTWGTRFTPDFNSEETRDEEDG